MTSAEPGPSAEEALEQSSAPSSSSDGESEAGSDSTPPEKTPLLQRVASLVIGTLVALLVGEVAVRIVVTQTLIYNIEMVRYAKELKTADPRGEVSHVHRPNASAHLMGVDIALNGLGHRGPDLPPKAAERKRVFVLGSSVTMGWGVPLEQMFTSLVEQRFNKEQPSGPATRVEIANAGIGNYNTIAQSRLFDHQYGAVKPDLVVLHYFISDPEPRPPGKNSLLLRHSYFAAYCYDRFRTLGLAAEGKNDLFKHYSDIYDDQQPHWNDTLAKISEMRDVAAKDNVRFVVMIIPDFHNLRPGTPYGALYEKMEKGFSARGIQVINTFPEFQKRYGGQEHALWIQRDDPHPNGTGHALMAELLYQELAKPDAFATDKPANAARP